MIFDCTCFYLYTINLRALLFHCKHVSVGKYIETRQFSTEWVYNKSLNKEEEKMNFGFNYKPSCIVHCTGRKSFKSCLFLKENVHTYIDLVGDYLACIKYGKYNYVEFGY